MCTLNMVTYEIPSSLFRVTYTTHTQSNLNIITFARGPCLLQTVQHEHITFSKICNHLDGGKELHVCVHMTLLLQHARIQPIVASLLR